MSLRIEKRYPIFGRDITEDYNPVEAGLGWTIRAKETDYPGKAVVEALKKTGTERTLVLIEMPEAANIPEAGATLTSAGQDVGQVTSAGMGHSVGRGLAMGYVASEMAVQGRSVDIGEAKAAKVHTGAIYDPKNTRSRG